MANTVDQDKEANPIAELFDEVFTLMQDLETRSVAVLEYLQEQGGVTDEKLAPYLDRAAAAADVRLRAARARMEHLLAPKPKSSTDVAKDDKAKGASQPQESGKESSSGGSPQGEKQAGAKPESKDLGKELASAPAGADKPAERKDDKSQNAAPDTEGKTAKSDQSSQQRKEASPNSSGSEAQAAALAGGETPQSQKGDNAKNQGTKPENSNSSNQPQGEEKQQTQKAAK